MGWILLKIILPVDLYGCETWHGLMMFRLRKVVRSKRDEVTELEEITLQGTSWLYSPVVIQVINSRRLRWVGNVACVGENRNVYIVLVELKNKGAFGRPRCVWEIILKWSLIETNSLQFLVQHVMGDRILLFLYSFYEEKTWYLQIYCSMFHHTDTTTVCSIILTQRQYVPS